MFADTHAHLTMPEYQDISDILVRAKSAGVELIINAGYDIESSRRSVALAKDHDFIYSAVGIHPHDAKVADKEAIKTVKELLKMPKVVAVGESGLDYHYKLSTKEEQRSLFVQLIDLATGSDLPIIVHGRESYDDIIEILDEGKGGGAGEGKGKGRGLRGVFHSFSGTLEQAKWAIQNGFYISFSGMLTFKKAMNIVEIATAVPIENILLETDCPYLTPEPFRGKRNEPAYVKYVAEALARIKGITPQEAGRITTENAYELFKIKKI